MRSVRGSVMARFFDVKNSWRPSHEPTSRCARRLHPLYSLIISMICRQPHIEVCTIVRYKPPCSSKAKFSWSVDYAVRVAPTVSSELAWNHTETVLKETTIIHFFATWLPFKWISELASWRRSSPLRDVTLSGSKFWWPFAFKKAC